MNKVTVINETGEQVTVQVIGSFRIEEYNKEYIMYTLNDDGVSEFSVILIAQIQNENGKIRLVSIPDSEKNMVAIFFDNIRDTACGNRKGQENE